MRRFIFILAMLTYASCSSKLTNSLAISAASVMGGEKISSGDVRFVRILKDGQVPDLEVLRNLGVNFVRDGKIQDLEVNSEGCIEISNEQSGVLAVRYQNLFASMDTLQNQDIFEEISLTPLPSGNLSWTCPQDGLLPTDQ